MRKRILALFVFLFACVLACASFNGVKASAAKSTKKITVTVTSTKKLKKAMKKSNVGTIIFKSDKVKKLTIPAVKGSAGKELIIEAPKAKVVNKAEFASITVNGAKSYTEKAGNTNITVNDKKTKTSIPASQTGDNSEKPLTYSFRLNGVQDKDNVISKAWLDTENKQIFIEGENDSLKKPVFKLSQGVVPGEYKAAKNKKYAGTVDIMRGNFKSTYTVYYTQRVAVFDRVYVAADNLVTQRNVSGFIVTQYDEAEKCYKATFAVTAAPAKVYAFIDNNLVETSFDTKNAKDGFAGILHAAYKGENADIKLYYDIVEDNDDYYHYSYETDDKGIIKKLITTGVNMSDIAFTEERTIQNGRWISEYYGKSIYSDIIRKYDENGKEIYYKDGDDSYYTEYIYDYKKDGTLTLTISTKNEYIEYSTVFDYDKDGFETYSKVLGADGTLADERFYKYENGQETYKKHITYNEDGTSSTDEISKDYYNGLVIYQESKNSAYRTVELTKWDNDGNVIYSSGKNESDSAYQRSSEHTYEYKDGLLMRETGKTVYSDSSDPEETIVEYKYDDQKRQIEKKEYKKAGKAKKVLVQSWEAIYDSDEYASYTKLQSYREDGTVSELRINETYKDGNRKYYFKSDYEEYVEYMHYSPIVENLYSYEKLEYKDGEPTGVITVRMYENYGEIGQTDAIRWTKEKGYERNIGSSWNEEWAPINAGEKSKITIKSGKGGKIVAYNAETGELIKSGDKLKTTTIITVYAEPDEGYEVDSLYIGDLKCDSCWALNNKIGRNFLLGGDVVMKATFKKTK